MLLQVVLAVVFLSCAAGQCPTGCQCGSNAVTCLSSARLSSFPILPKTTERVIIFSNPLTYISESALMNLKELTSLTIREANINYITYSAFDSNTKLELIDLEGNGITAVDPHRFKNLNQLDSLSLKSNELSVLRDDIFFGLGNLTKLYLNNNNLKMVPFSTLKPLTSLQLLDLSGNQLVCDCEMSWMKNYDPLSGSVTCSSPAHLTGQSINSLSYQQLGCVRPKVVPARSSVLAYEGEVGTELSCVMTGSPMPKLSWFYKGEKVFESLFYRLPKNGSLFIIVMQPQLAGNYTCMAENVMGNSSQTITLNYGGTRIPSFRQVPTAVHAFVGETFTLPCLADEVTDSYRWFKDSRDISSDPTFNIYPGVGLSVSSASKRESGTYTCVAMNEMGEVNVSALVQITSSVITCDGVLDPSIMEGLRERVDVAFNLTQQELRRSNNSPISLLRKLKFPSSGIIEYLKAAEIFDQAVKRIRDQLAQNSTIRPEDGVLDLSSCELEVLGRLSGCEDNKKQVRCTDCFHRKYRSLDGTCNNLDYPLQGAADTPFKRLLRPMYEDGVGLPVGWSSGKPSARLISSKIIAANKVQGSTDFTLMLMQVGQFLDHDMDLAPTSPSNIAFDTNNPTTLSSCNSICKNDAPCFPIPVPQDDPRITRECLPFTRSSAVCGTGAPSLLLGSKHIFREQINVLSSYIDGSMIYSSIVSTAEKIRNRRRGKLNEGIRLSPMSRPLLPFDNDSLIECSTGIHANRSKCFLAGDMRANEQVGLTSMHTIMLREHNRVADALLDLNPHWNAEKLYQESRKIVVAEWQNIVYTEYLPKILGKNYFKKYEGYNPNTDASISNGFATAAYRFGHSQIMPFFQRLDSDYQPLPIGPLMLKDAFFAPFRIVEEGGIEPLIRGLLASPVKRRVSHQGLNTNLTEALFQQANEIALDLAAFNIQRGRDHGLPSYNRWRAFCNLTAPRTIDGLRDDISNASTRRLLREVYGDNPDNIDLWVGGLLEDLQEDSQLGPTFRCIIGDQFSRLRQGDRFYYEREGQFTPDQLVQIRQSSLSRLICDNADGVHKVPTDAFVLADPADFTSCDQLPTADLFLWKEFREDCREPTFRVRRSTLLKSSQSGVEQVNRRISKLEEKLQNCNYNGQVHESGKSWTISNCFKCFCQHGVTRCEDTCTETAR